MLFLAALLVAAAGGVWWLGPGIVTLALDETRRNEPYHLLHLAASEEAETPRYVGRFSELSRAEEGELVWRGGLDRLLDGRVRDEWTELMLFEFAGGGNFVQLVTSAEYRELTGDKHLLLLGTQTPPQALAQSAIVLLWLIESPEADSTPASIDSVLANLDGFSGSVIWDTPVDNLRETDGWNRIVLIAFADVAQAEAWYREPLTVTERTLAGTLLLNQAWLLIRSGLFQG